MMPHPEHETTVVHEPQYTSSPDSKDVAGWPVGSRPPPLTERSTTDSGQMVISKRIHADALLLILYCKYTFP